MTATSTLRTVASLLLLELGFISVPTTQDVPENEVLEKQRASTILEMGHQIVNELIGTLFMKVS